MTTNARRVGPYGKLLANYQDDDAIIAAGEKAELLFCRGIAFCSNSDSDGYITDGQLVRRVGAGMKDAEARAKVLVNVGLWVRVEGGYQVRSYIKINETAEERGRKRRTDRERKRAAQGKTEGIPNGFRTDSERNPSDFHSQDAADSLDYVVCSTAVLPTVQSTEVQSSATTPLAERAPNAGQIVGAWVDHCDSRPPSRVVGQVAKHVGEMLNEGIDAEHVTRGLALWHQKGNLAPSVLPSFVNQAMNRPRAVSRQQDETDALFERAATRLGVVK